MNVTISVPKLLEKDQQTCLLRRTVLYQLADIVWDFNGLRILILRHDAGKVNVLLSLSVKDNMYICVEEGGSPCSRFPKAFLWLAI